ncbi:TPA: hypothetical protein DEA20_04155 [Candidatus Dependentiae bacterium]|nr:hypothetical protein [Candidatus Dependentiae bacterium]
MPQNITVFENIGPTLYESLYHQFQRSGYSIVEKRRDAFCLKTKIDSFNDSSARFISLDVVPYLFRVEIVIKCELFDKNEKLIAKKEFKFSKWFSRPKDAILDPKFLKYQYTELLNRAVIKIDQYFKKYLLKDFQKS